MKDELEKLKDLNFMISNQIQEIEFSSKRTQSQIANLKVIDFFQEDKREIFYLNNLNDKFTNYAFRTILKEMRQTLTKKSKEQNRLRKKAEELENKIEMLTNSAYHQKYEKKYINTTDIIEEDEGERKDNSIMISKQDEIPTGNNLDTEGINIDGDITEKIKVRRIQKANSLPKLDLKLVIPTSSVNGKIQKEMKIDYNNIEKDQFNRAGNDQVHSMKNYVSLNGNIINNKPSVYSNSNKL